MAIAKHIEAGAGPTFHVIGGDRITLKVTGAETDGAYTLFETTVPAGGGPPPHLHRREDETFYVVAGEFEFNLDGETIRADEGAVLVAPRDKPHCFRNVGAEDGKLLISVHPAGFEDFIAAFAELSPSEPPDFVRMAEIVGKYGIELMPPPT